MYKKPVSEYFSLPHLNEIGIRCHQLRNGAPPVYEQYFKRLIKIIVELSAMALVALLLQEFIEVVGFEAAWPILLGILLAILILIVAMRKQ